MTLEHSLMGTWRLPLFSALLIFFRASARTFTHTIMEARKDGGITITSERKIDVSLVLAWIGLQSMFCVIRGKDMGWRAVSEIQVAEQCGQIPPEPE